MRSLAIVGGLLLAACVTAPTPSPDAPTARFAHADLDLSRPSDQAMLVDRVARAAADYCDAHAALVTPHHRRADPRYCPESLRVQLMWAMPDPVRRAYDQGRARRPADQVRYAENSEGLLPEADRR